jgi:hypothetical protein
MKKSQSQMAYKNELKRNNKLIRLIYAKIKPRDKDAQLRMITDPLHEGMNKQLLYGYFPFRFECFFIELDIIVFKFFHNRTKQYAQDYLDLISVYPSLDTIKKYELVGQIFFRTPKDENFEYFKLDLKPAHLLERYNRLKKTFQHMEYRNDLISRIIEKLELKEENNYGY